MGPGFYSNNVYVLIFMAFLCLLLPLTSDASELIYTIQTGSYSDVKDARIEYESIEQVLHKEALAYLRIEKIGKYYSVRIGNFKLSDIAYKFHQSVKSRLTSSLVMKAYIKDERIEQMYAGPELTSTDGLRDQSLSVSAPDIETSWVRGNTESADISAEVHEKRGDRYLSTDQYFLAVTEYNHAIHKGRQDPVLYRKLARILYQLKFVDESIVEMEKAVQLAPHSNTIKIELGKLYLVKDKLDDAEKQFLAALKINPGYTNAHYYLGEIYLRKGKYEMAWYAAKAALGLGHQSQNLIRKLELLSDEPDTVPWDREEGLYIRQILVESLETAADLMSRIADGEMFENIANSNSKVTGKPVGGYIGRFSPSEIHPEIARALLSQDVYFEPVIVQTEKGYHIVQRIASSDFYFRENLLAATKQL